MCSTEVGSLLFVIVCKLLQHNDLFHCSLFTENCIYPKNNNMLIRLISYFACSSSHQNGWAYLQLTYPNVKESSAKYRHTLNQKYICLICTVLKFYT